MAQRLEIRNSTAEFLIFQIENKEQGVEVMYAEETIWCTQKALATLFDCDRSVISKHLAKIFESGELKSEAVCANFAHTASDGKTYQTRFYSLDAVIAVGYRVNSIRATQFRQWSTFVLRQYAIRGYVLDKKRMENGTLSFMSPQGRFIGKIQGPTKGNVLLRKNVLIMDSVFKIPYSNVFFRRHSLLI